MDRVQRSRKKGFRLPPHTLCVTRGTHFGNKYKIVKPGYGYVIHGDDLITVPYFSNKKDATEGAVELFYEWLKRPEQDALCKEFIARCVNEKIEHIACFCGLKSCCHGDVWLELFDHYDSYVLFDLIGWNGLTKKT